MVYTASFAFFEAIWDAGVRYCFVNLGSDHPSILEAIVKGQKERRDRFPKIITCPNEMVALSMADGYARQTNQPQCVIVHVDVGTQGLGAAVHNASTGRAPVLIFAGLSPYTQDGEMRGSRTEYIHWVQDVPDQKQIVSQYCRWTGEVKTGRNIKQLVNRALSFAMSDPKGPVYLYGAREAMEQDLEPYTLNQSFWTPVQPAALPESGVRTIAEALVHAAEPLVVTGYLGRNREAVTQLVSLADTIKGLRVVDSAGSDMCFPASHPGSLGLRFGVDDSIRTADVILVIDCDVPWIPTQCKPREDAKIFHVDVDPLKHQIPVFYIDAMARFRADAATALAQLNAHIAADPQLTTALAHPSRSDRWQRLLSQQSTRRDALAATLTASTTTIATTDDNNKTDHFNTAHLVSRLATHCPADTLFAIEAVTETVTVHTHLALSRPGAWTNCGGGGLGWSGGASLGIKLASLDSASPASSPSPLVVQIVGDGTFVFSVPSAVYWIASRYAIPTLTVVLNNGGWHAPRRSLLLVHPDGEASRASREELGISFEPTMDYAGIARAAAGAGAGGRGRAGGDDDKTGDNCKEDGKEKKRKRRCWIGRVWRRSELDKVLGEAVRAVVQDGRSAVVDAQLGGPEGKYQPDPDSSSDDDDD